MQVFGIIFGVGIAERFIADTKTLRFDNPVIMPNGYAAHMGIQ
jgi:hypothetical protein